MHHESLGKRVIYMYVWVVVIPYPLVKKQFPIISDIASRERRYKDIHIGDEHPEQERACRQVKVGAHAGWRLTVAAYTG